MALGNDPRPAREERTGIRVSEVGEFIRFQSCERRFKLGLENRRLARNVPFSERLFNALDPVLQEVGREAEDKWEAALQEQGLTDLTRLSERAPDARTTTWDHFRLALELLPAGTAAYGREIEIAAPIGAFNVTGRIDFFVVLWDRGTLRIRLVEGKASRKDRTYHRIQLAAYLIMLRHHLTAAPLEIAGQAVVPSDIEAAVARIDEITNEPQNILERSPLNLDTEVADIERLLAAGGTLDAIVHHDLEGLDFQLNAKCDGCVFSVHCFPESARQRRLELIGIDPTTARVLRANGVGTIDELAAVNLASPVAAAIKQADNFNENLAQLVTLAATRRSTLPRGENDPDNFQVQPLPNAGQGQLPLHEINGTRLVRVYLEVNYDYSENRIGALAAHVTTSNFELYSPFDPNTRRPAPDMMERLRTNPNVQDQPPQFDTRLLAGSSRDVIHFQTQPWSGIGDQDTGAERQLVQQFLFDLVDAIAEVAQADRAPIHFYVYSRSEMTQLVEACTRAGSTLLSRLRELLGCREGLEQLIFSCVQDEITNRFALGWTGRGLGVATSLGWFGQRYHWTRRVGGVAVALDQIFEQDIFDYRTTLDLTADGNWARGEQDRVGNHRFEIRSRFHDTLTAPYWRALWRALPAPDDPQVVDRRVKAAIVRYNRIVERPGLMRSYLTARVHALRWVEERVRFKNDEIDKPLLEIANLQQFELGINTTALAAIDFLRLDHHVGMTDWLTSHIQPPAARVQSGRTIPVRNVATLADGTVSADFDVEPFGLTPAELSLRTAIDEGSFVRVSPRGADIDRGQTIRQLTAGGITCAVRTVDWINGTMTLDALPYRGGSTYILPSRPLDPNLPVFDFASVDESPSDFVAGRVEARLRAGQGGHVYAWFEPSDPTIPAQTPIVPARMDRVRRCIESWQVPHGHDRRSALIGDQRDAVIDGLESRVQLLKGPPGTGKTVTTAASVLARAAARLRTGGIILVAAHTRLAVGTLLARLLQYRDSFRQEADRQGLAPDQIVLTHVHSSDPPADTDGIQNFPSKPCVQRVNRWRTEGILVIGGTTNALLKMVEELNARRPFIQQAGGFQADVLVVDESSMMVFPHFLALASLVGPQGEIMLAGDNRQLAPIVAHDWESEDRPPAQYYQPFKSAYEAVLRIVEENGPPLQSARQSPLTFTFRLPPIIRELISRVYRDLDDIELQGLDGLARPAQPPAGDWSDVWADDNGLILAVHAERTSRQSNGVEGDIVDAILGARQQHPADSIAVITPHRAQRALLRRRLQNYGDAVTIIDTVERLQGGERPTIIVSGTESDPHAIGAAASFILNLNRANVAFSRTQERLIVVCAETLLDHIPADLEDYESAMLWKSLRNLCSRPLLVADVQGYRVTILAPLVRDGGRA